jgi:gliding-associated putative ABC transporter substrate-binding component GldG
MKRRSQHAVAALASTLVLLGILLVVNLISTQVFTRVDLSEGNIYTLSRASRDLVRNLDETVVAKAFFTPDLEPPYNSIETYLRDLLDDYKAYSGGQFDFEFVDPGSDSLMEQEAMNYQIQAGQINVVRKDKLEVKKVYMGLVLIYEDRHETLPMIQNTAGLEYDISSTVKRLTAVQRTRVGFLQGFGAPDFFQGLKTVRQILERNYDLAPVRLIQNQMVPDDIDVLIVSGLNQELDEWSKYAIDQFIMRGGKTAFLVNKVDANLQNQQARPARLGLDPWMSQYGIKINDDLVQDRRSGMINVQEPRGFMIMSYAMPYPFFVQVVNFNKEHPMVKDLEDVMLYFSSTIDTSLASDKGLSLTPLFSSSDKTKLQTGRFDISPAPRIDYSDYLEGPYVLAAAVSGEFHSYFEGRDVPRGDTAAAAYGGTTAAQSPETRIVVAGDAHLLADDYLRNSPGNAALLMNMVDWLAMDEQLMQIRTREVTNRPVAEVSEGVKTTVKYANILGPATLVVILGLVRWQVRRRRKNVGFTL